MSTITEQEATLWFMDGRPVRMVTAGRRWRVTDVPTRITGEPAWLPPLIAHAPTDAFVGWRFQASSELDSHVFDVLETPDGGWVITRTWD